ncbi:MAG: TFIIB-type zinc ribbon-containing protein [Desulfurococcaceae archaeon]
MKCTHCGGLLVWDYEHGEVVCSTCGLVHDKLTSLELPDYRTGASNVEVSSARRGTRSLKRIPPREYRYRAGLYVECLRLTRGKPWLEIDFDRVFKTGRFIHAITSRASLKALKNIEAHNYWKDVNEGLKHIYSINPAYLTRSERSKYALAYMVAVRLKTGRYPSRERVVSVFNISDTSYRRLCLLAERLLMLHMGRNRKEARLE